MKCYIVKIDANRTARFLQDQLNDAFEEIDVGLCDCKGQECVSLDPSSYHQGHVTKICSHMIKDELWFFIFYEEINETYIDYDLEERE